MIMAHTFEPAIVFVCVLIVSRFELFSFFASCVFCCIDILLVCYEMVFDWCLKYFFGFLYFVGELMAAMAEVKSENRNAER